MKKSFKLWFIVILAVFLILGGITALAAPKPPAEYLSGYSVVGDKISPTQPTYSYAGANFIVIKQSTEAIIWVADSVSASDDEILLAFRGDEELNIKPLDSSLKDMTDSEIFIVRGDTEFDFNTVVGSNDPNLCFEVKIDTDEEEITIRKFTYGSDPRAYVSDYVSHILLVNKDTEDFGSFKVSKVVNGDNAPVGTVFDILVAFASSSSLSGITFDGSTDDVEIEATTTPGEYAVKLLDGEYAIFTNIPLNNTSYSVTEDDSSLSEYWTIPSSALTGSITGTTQVAVDVNNSYEGPDYGSLEVSKNVTGDVTDGDELFEITVIFTLGQNGSLDDIDYSSDVDEDDLDMTVSTDSSTYTFYLQDDESIRFYNIPMGVTYDITEDLSDLQDGWELTTDDEDLMGAIDNTTEQSVTVVNDFDEPELGSLRVIKNVTDGDTAKRFEITVTFALPSITPMSISLADIDYESYVDVDDLDMDDSTPGTFIFWLKDGEYVDFTNIPFGVTYTVSEDLTGETDWEGVVDYPTDSQAHLINNGVMQTVNVNNDYDAPPEYGLLRVAKMVEEGASTTEEFDIRVQFTGSRGDMADIEYNEEDSNIVDGPDMDEVDEGVYTMTFYLSLHDGESVDFTNIPMYVLYSVTEVLTDDQEAADWDGPNSAATGSIETTTRQTVTVYNEIGGGGGDDPKYGSLKVIKNISGDGASDTEKFDITVTFEGSTSNLNKIDFSDGDTESDGVYELSLSDDEYVIFSNIPMGVSYTVSEDLTDDEEAAGWTGPDSDATGRIRGTSQQLVTVENTYEQGEVLGEKEEAEEEEDSGVLGVSEKIDPELPKTGGVSTTMQLLLIGLALVAIGTAVGLKKKHDAQ